MKTINVMKIGGAVLNRPENFVFLLTILQKYCSTRTFFVFSAFSTLSRKLKEIGFTAKNEGFELALKKFEEVKFELDMLSKKIFFGKRFSNNGLEKLFQLYNDFEKILFGISVTRELTNRTLDRLLSFGEHISAVILEEFVKKNNIDAIFVDACDYIITDANYGNAKPIYQKTEEAIKGKLIRLFEQTSIIFIPGFIGCSELNTVTTMGFESSNLTALLLASIVGANSVTFWTDVDGIHTSDPKIVDKTLPIPEISFEDAKIASLNGLKLIHPTMYDYFVANPSIEYHYKSAFSPENKGTLVLQNTNSKPGIILISEPYLLRELPAKQIAEFEVNCALSIISRDFAFCLEDGNYHHESGKAKISIITLLNFETKNVLSALMGIDTKVMFFYFDKSKNLCKIIVDDSHLKEVANYLHNFLVLKK